MFNKSKIADLHGIVGLRQPYDPDYQIIDAANLVSRSNYFVTDNPYVKVQYLKETQDYDKISDADFNTEVKQIQESAIASVMNAVFNGSDYIDRQVLYKYAQNRVNTETLESGLLTHKIEVSNCKNIAFEITRILLDFEGTGTIKLMLFNSSQTAPIFSKDIAITSNHQVEALNWRVDNSGDTYKGEYYLGYLTNSGTIGTLKPYKRDYERSDIESNITHLNIQKFIFDGHTTETLPDLTTEESTDVATGLNPDITVFDDFTDLILNNEMLFGYAVYLDMSIKIISRYAASLRSNRNQRLSEQQVLRMIAEIEGQPGDAQAIKITGLRPQLIGELKRLTKEVMKLKEGYFGGRIMVDTLQ